LVESHFDRVADRRRQATIPLGRVRAAGGPSCGRPIPIPIPIASTRWCPL